MSKNDEFKKKVIRLISDDRIDEAISLMIKSSNSIIEDELILLSNRHNNLQRQIRQRVITEENKNIEKNSIVNSLIKLLNSPNSFKRIGHKKPRFIRSIFILFIISLTIILFFVVQNRNIHSFPKEQNGIKEKSLKPTNKLLKEINIDANTDIIPSNSYDYKNSQIMENRIEGDFDGDGKKEFLFIERDSPQQEDFGGVCILIVRSSNFGIIKIKSCPHLNVKNVGDLNDDGGDEISVRYVGDSAMNNRIEVYSYSNASNWYRLVQFSTRMDEYDLLENRILKKEKGYFIVIEDIFTEDTYFERIHRVITN